MRPGWAAIVILPTVLAPALAFDDKQFCAAAQQLAIAAEGDIGVWIDRVTRNAGMAVACDRRMVEFTRFTYVASAAMTEHWKADRAKEWSSAQCNSVLWREAIDNGWAITLTVAAADGGRAIFKAQCR